MHRRYGLHSFYLDHNLFLNKYVYPKPAVELYFFVYERDCFFHFYF